MFNLLSIILETTTLEVGKFSWEFVATVLGVTLLITEAIIRMYIHNSKMKKDILTEKTTNTTYLTDSEIQYLKSLSQTIININSQTNGFEIKIKNVEDDIDELKSLLRDVERDNFKSLSKVSDKIDVLKNILLEAQMKSKK